MGIKLGLQHYGKKRPSIFDNRALRKVSVFKSEQVTGDWRKLHSEELKGL
jgi:hypothetical protein